MKFKIEQLRPISTVTVLKFIDRPNEQDGFIVDTGGKAENYYQVIASRCHYLGAYAEIETNKNLSDILGEDFEDELYEVNLEYWEARPKGVMFLIGNQLYDNSRFTISADGRVIEISPSAQMTLIEGFKATYSGVINKIQSVVGMANVSIRFGYIAHIM